MIKVLKSGFYSTIQDSGRIDYQEYGVPYSGVMDSYSAAIANALLGNNEQSAVIEITMTGPTLQFANDIAICISGANMSPKLNSNLIELNKSISVKAGDTLSFGKLNYGFRCYLAVSGGFKTGFVMNSYSMYKGVTERFRISKNDILKTTELTNAFDKKNASLRINEAHFITKTIDCFEGPEFDKLSDFKKEKLFSQEFTISNNNNRMAYQLVEPLKNDLKSIITSSVLPGTVQLTPSGKLIILMRDCQTTGGYPRILQLKESAINVLAQKYTGNTISFKLLKY